MLLRPDSRRFFRRSSTVDSGVSSGSSPSTPWRESRRCSTSHRIRATSLPSGSKKPKRTAGRRLRTTRRKAQSDLTGWQAKALRAIRTSALAPELVFGGGAALSSVFLHHRLSEDLDFFLRRQLEPADLASLKRTLVRHGNTVDEHANGPVHSLVLTRGSKTIGKIDFALYPYDPLDPPLDWQGMRVESLLDMTVNKVQAILTRFQPRDFVDLYFMLREGPVEDLDRLLELVRKKFESGADRLALANRLLAARSIEDLPRMLRKVDLESLREFFFEKARELVRRG